MALAEETAQITNCTASWYGREENFSSPPHHPFLSHQLALRGAGENQAACGTAQTEALICLRRRISSSDPDMSFFDGLGAGSDTYDVEDEIGHGAYSEVRVVSGWQ